MELKRNINNELFMLQHHMSTTVKQGRSFHPSLGDELENLMVKLLHSVQASLVDLNTLGILKGHRITKAQQEMLINVAYAEFADIALELWDRFRDVTHLDRCLALEVNS